MASFPDNMGKLAPERFFYRPDAVPDAQTTPSKH